MDRAALERVVHGITTFPDDFHVHPKLEGFLKKRQEILRGAPIDWATAETLAFGTLVLEHTPVRLSGQDSGRGTFSQRHLELYDSETGERYIPLAASGAQSGALRCFRQLAQRVRGDGL